MPPLSVLLTAFSHPCAVFPPFTSTYTQDRPSASACSLSQQCNNAIAPGINPQSCPAAESTLSTLQSFRLVGHAGFLPVVPVVGSSVEHAVVLAGDWLVDQAVVTLALAVRQSIQLYRGSLMTNSTSPPENGACQKAISVARPLRKGGHWDRSIGTGGSRSKIVNCLRSGFAIVKRSMIAKWLRTGQNRTRQCGVKLYPYAGGGTFLVKVDHDGVRLLEAEWDPLGDTGRWEEQYGTFTFSVKRNFLLLLQNNIQRKLWALFGSMFTYLLTILPRH